MLHSSKEVSLSEMVESTETIIRRLLEFLTPLLPLANSHVVDFIVSDTWNKLVPENIRSEFQSCGAEYILNSIRTEGGSHLSEFVRSAQLYVPEKCTNFHTLESLDFEDLVQPVRITEFMTSKKLHEVERMSKVVANVAKIYDTDLIVDIGSGKGYLISILALHYKLRVLGLDCQRTNICGAVRTTTKLERKWRIYDKSWKNRQVNTAREIVKDSCTSQEEYYEKYKWKSAVVGDLFKLRVENVFEGTTLRSVLAEEYPERDEHKVLLTGLHTCGNLAANCLRLFVQNEDTNKSIVHVGCCYHLIDEEFVDSPPWYRAANVESSRPFPGFPMSAYLKSKRFSLGRDARMCGTQNPSKIFKHYDINGATKPLFYRALLQELLEKKSKTKDLCSRIVGRIAHKCCSFQEYASKAFKKLNVQVNMSAEELDAFFEQHIDYWEKLKVFFVMKTALSSVIETVILQDRLLYLHEKGIENAFVTRLFDPVISPRCYALVAYRRTPRHMKNGCTEIDVNSLNDPSI